MADDLMARITEYARDKIVAEGRCDFDALLPDVYERFGEAIEAHWQQMAREHIRRQLKTRLAKWEDEDDPDAVIQTKLPGFQLPQFISVPGEGGRVVWVHSLAATQADAFAQRQLRETNIVRAVRKRDVWDQMLDRLDPAWRTHPDFTIGECIDWLADTQQAKTK